jgi:hypothetical protein
MRAILSRTMIIKVDLVSYDEDAYYTINFNDLLHDVPALSGMQGYTANMIK